MFLVSHRVREGRDEQEDQEWGRGIEREEGRERANEQDWKKELKRRTTTFDLEHQVTRLKKMTRLSEDELAAIYAALAINIRDYNQVVEVSLCLIDHWRIEYGIGLMIALDVLASIYWWSSAYCEWSTASTSCHSRGCSYDITGHGSISGE